MEAILLTAAFLWIAAAIYKKLRRQQLKDKIHGEVAKLVEIVRNSFLIQPCPRCHENVLRLIDLSPNARSIQCECAHCGKKMRAAAATPDADKAITFWNNALNLVSSYNSISKASTLRLTIEFDTPSAALPFEQTTRSPIPEAVRSEVWRRDHGKCVQCNSKENLQFDHIIPVSRGGATSVKNLQLLCQRCNSLKGSRI